MLFKGREDVYALFWMNEQTGKKGFSPACENPWAPKGKPKKYLPLTDQALHDHLAGKATIGIYPLLNDNQCWFLACDFDKGTWLLDALAFLNVCRQFGVPACLERSQSGNGGHVWIFFSSTIPAVTARQLGMRLLHQTMIVRAEMDLASYDRFFPNQDFVPRGGFGNLIALPLQKRCRLLGNTEFIDPDDSELRPYPDQWAFLSRIQRLSPTHLEALLEKIPLIQVGSGSKRSVSISVRERSPAPRQIRCHYGAVFSIEKSGLPPWLLSQIKHLACFHNPKFYELQNLRLSTFRVPRFIKCYEEDIGHIHLPRGTFDEIQEVLKDAGSEVSLTEQRPIPKRLRFKFLGSLRPDQKKAMEEVLPYETGVLVAPPGAGKTVMGCYAVAKRNVPTLILGHRKPILEQWRNQLLSLLGLSSREIGQVGGGRHRQSGIIDLAMIQSLKGVDDLEAFFSEYGFIIVDECHHLPALTFENCIKKATAKYFLGLTATPYRRDGLQEIITMQCGPIRYKLDQEENALPSSLIVKETSFHVRENGMIFSIQELFGCLLKDEGRNKTIEKDIQEALSDGRRCLVLSHRKEHAQLLSDCLSQGGKTPILLSGAVGKKKRSSLLKSIQDRPPDEDLLIIATGQYLGEGFDCPQIDTLFLTDPISFKGKLVQYVGRILRDHQNKKNVVVYDYVDSQVPVLRKMYLKRLRSYKSLGFKIEQGVDA